MKQKGFSLVELMVALTLGLLMSAALVNVFISSTRTYQEDDELARMQENARYALRLLSRELSMSGFMGGVIDLDALVASTDVSTASCESVAWVSTPSPAVELVDNVAGSDYTTTVGKSLDCLADVQPNSDVLVVKRTADSPTVEDGVLKVAAAKDNQLYLQVADYGADLSYEFVGSGDVPDNMTPGNKTDYWEYYPNIFYVRDHSDPGSDDGIPTLCVKHLKGDSLSSDCLVEGVQSVQVEFGVDSDGDFKADYFVTAPDASESDSVVTAKIYVLMRSIAQVPGYTNDVSYTLGSTPILNPATGAPAFNDGFYRRVFSTTVKLRNPMRI